MKFEKIDFNAMLNIIPELFALVVMYVLKTAVIFAALEKGIEVSHNGTKEDKKMFSWI